MIPPYQNRKLRPAINTPAAIPHGPPNIARDPERLVAEPIASDAEPPIIKAERAF